METEKRITMEIPQFCLFNFEDVSFNIQVKLRPKSTWAEQLHSTHVFTLVPSLIVLMIKILQKHS